MLGFACVGSPFPLLLLVIVGGLRRFRRAQFFCCSVVQKLCLSERPFYDVYPVLLATGYKLLGVLFGRKKRSELSP